VARGFTTTSARTGAKGTGSPVPGGPAVLPRLAAVVEPDERGHGTQRAAGRPPGLTVACVVLGIEALGLLAGTVVQLVDSLFGHPTNRAGAVLAAGLAFLGALTLAYGARGLLRLRPAARTPIVVLQILAVPVGYQLAFDSERPEWGGPILVAALVVLYLLFTPPVRAVLDRPEPSR